MPPIKQPRSSFSIHQPSQQNHQQHSQNQQPELQISEFIKDPSTLKLLILAGTNIKSSQLLTVSKCSNLIKLDLSSNMLSDLSSIQFSKFHQLKILYLHDNNIFSIKLQKTSIQYISLFNNPIKGYRQGAIQKNDKIIGLDYNIVTKRQYYYYQNQDSKTLYSLPLYTQIKWPIVQANKGLQNEQDYLNLLKAEIFVITNLYKKAISYEHIQNILKTVKEFKKYEQMVGNLSDDMKIKKSCVLDAVHQWKNYVNKKKKLRHFLEGKGKQQLLYNNLDIRKLKQSPKAIAIIQRFLSSVRQRLKVRHVLESLVRSYRSYIPISSQLIDRYYKNSHSVAQLYFLKSEVHFLEKIFLYCKRLLFNRKQYDLCDNFQKIMSRNKIQYYVFRRKRIDPNQRYSFLLESVKNSMGLVVGQKDLDRKYLLYTKRGHKQIKLKSRFKFNLKKGDKQKMESKVSSSSKKINQLYDRYDLLVSYSVKDQKLYELLLKIIRYFNAGNSATILSNQTAYFQTQVVFQDQQSKNKRQKLFVGLQFFIKRALAANSIQKWWKKVYSKKKSNISVIKSMKQNRASKMISNWVSNLMFHHKLLVNKSLSYNKTIQKSAELYIQLEIYMNLPDPTNWLKVQKYKPLVGLENGKQIFYTCLHTNSSVQIVEMSNRKWIKVSYSSVKQVLQVQKIFQYLTWRFYYNGFSLRLFNYFEIQQQKMLQDYEKKVKKLFNVVIGVNKKDSTNSFVDTPLSAKISRKLGIENPNPYFIWAQVGQKGIENKFNLQKKSTPISIFVYNKHQKPLKVNCDLNWISPSSIYYNKNTISKNVSLGSTFRSRTPTRKLSQTSKEKSALILQEEVKDLYFLKSMQKRNRRNSQIAPHHTSLLMRHQSRSKGASEHIKIDLLSQTLNIRRK